MTTIICKKLFEEKKTLQTYKVNALASQEAYKAPEDRIAPPGYRNATDKDLEAFGLTKELIEPKNSDFRAAIYTNEDIANGPIGAPLVAFKGTESLSDWCNNGKQALGLKSSYYEQAQKIANFLEESDYAESVSYTGHSLGGGLAATAAGAYSRSAISYNAAGLSLNTIKQLQLDDANITVIKTKGEFLSATQESTPLPKAFGKTQITYPPTPSDVEAYKK
ncbi:DUF2974 domain-containing protein (plasmid) [Acetobacteraceae bacterium]|nr:DUF2974 domain-containing protein [Acetobacteraceae bacterium]